MTRFAKNLYIACLLVFLYFPLFFLVLQSFNEVRLGPGFAFTLKWYFSLFQNHRMLEAFQTSLILAVLSASLATFLGLVAAIGLYRASPRVRSLAVMFNNITLVTPDLVIALTYLILFSFIKLPLGFGSLVLSHTAFCLVYVIVLVVPQLQKIPKSMYEAAMDLGSSQWHFYQKIFLPELLPSLFVSFFISFTLSLDDFIISFFTTGRGVKTFALYVHSVIRRGPDPQVNAMATLFFLMVLICVFLIYSSVGRHKRTKDRNLFPWGS